MSYMHFENYVIFLVVVVKFHYVVVWLLKESQVAF